MLRTQAEIDIEMNEKEFQFFLQDLNRDCYKELWNIIDIDKVIDDPIEKKRIMESLN